MVESAAASLVAVFGPLEEEDLRALLGMCRVRNFRRGEVLFHEEDAGNAFFILRSGQVKIVLLGRNAEETILWVYGPGGCLGELSLVDGGPRSATAVALDRVEALTLARDDFLALIERRPSIALTVMRRLAGMVRRVNTQVQDVVLLDVTARIAKKLVELAEQHGEPTPAGIRITLRITQEELAQMVGVTRVSVNKKLCRFQQRGVLTVDRDGITIHKLQELQKRVY